MSEQRNDIEANNAKVARTPTVVTFNSSQMGIPNMKIGTRIKIFQGLSKGDPLNNLIKRQ